MSALRLPGRLTIVAWDRALLKCGVLTSDGTWSRSAVEEGVHLDFGAVEFAYDASPIISATPIGGLYVSTGWYGGFKSIPVGGLTYAHLLATGAPHPLAEAFQLERFLGLKFLLEAGTVAQRQPASRCCSYRARGAVQDPQASSPAPARHIRPGPRTRMR